jgi:hypothetical protein
MCFQVIAVYWLAGLATTHALPDNHIERAVQVYVHAERIEVHYHLGLTDRQVRSELAALAPGEPVPDDPAAALRCYEQRVAPRLAEQLRLTVDGELWPLSVSGVDRRERHHERFVVQCEAPLPLGPEPRRIEVRDLSEPGAAAIECRRMALRGRGEVEVTDCSGQPTLVRVPRRPAPAVAYRLHDPSRTILAMCRIPAAIAATDSPEPEVLPLQPDGEPNHAVDGLREVADEPSGAITADPADSPPDRAGTRSLAAVGIGLILLGCGFAAAAVRNSRSRRGAVRHERRRSGFQNPDRS